MKHQPTLTKRQVALLCRISGEEWIGTWLRPMDVGGRDGTHHCQTLTQLVRKGLAARQLRGGHTRPAWGYCITAAGRREAKYRLALGVCEGWGE